MNLTYKQTCLIEMAVAALYCILCETKENTQEAVDTIHKTKELNNLEVKGMLAEMLVELKVLKADLKAKEGK